MILKRKNPNANPNNALQIVAANGICCGDESPVIVCDYALTFSSSVLTSVNQIQLGGVTYGFSQSVATGTVAGRAALKAEIRAALAAAGYTQDGVTVTANGVNVTVTLSDSQLVIGWLQSASYPFVKSGCVPYGNFKGGNCEVVATGRIIADPDDFIISIAHTSTAVTNVLVVEGSTTLYNGMLVPGEGNDATANWSGNNAVYIDISTAGYDDVTKTFTITLTTADCGTISTTVTQVFPNV